MAAIPNPTSGGYFDDALFDDFASGFDVDINQYASVYKVRRAEATTMGSGQRIDIVRAEQTTMGSAQRVDE